MSRDDILARLRKIKSLADHGEGGEAANAAALLDTIAAEHGIDLDAIDAALVSDHVFKTGVDGWRQKLFCQIVWCRDRKMELYSCRSDRRTRGHDAIKLRCADDFFVEVVAAFEVLSRDYDRQRKALFRAFLAANDLLLEASADDEPRKPLSDAERCLLEDAARLSLGIEKTMLRKQLTGA
ncbi:MAG: hypothetical protein IKH04_13035 [Kiritimatiellae bacterium]|nr:hypothetical protein [Kiritimatiellia bacterium]